MKLSREELLGLGLVAAFLLLKRQAAPVPMVRRRLCFSMLTAESKAYEKARDAGVAGAAIKAMTVRELWVVEGYPPVPDRGYVWRACDVGGRVGDTIGEGEFPFPDWDTFWSSPDYPEGAEKFTPFPAGLSPKPEPNKGNPT